MADVAQLARTLNLVESVGQSRAAMRMGIDHLDAGALLAERLSWFSSPTTDEAQSTLTIIRGQLATELRMQDGRDDGSPVDASDWARQRRGIERAYVEVSGIEGVVGALASVSFLDELGTAIAQAPGLIGDYAARAAAAIAPAAFGLGTLLVLALLVLVAVRARAGA